MGHTVPNPHNHQHNQQGGRSPGASLPAPDVPQAESVAAWLRWHAIELAGLGVPLALAVLVSVWFVALAVPAAGLWAINEARHSRQRTLRTGERTALTSASTREEIDR